MKTISVSWALTFDYPISVFDRLVVASNGLIPLEATSSWKVVLSHFVVVLCFHLVFFFFFFVVKIVSSWSLLGIELELNCSFFFFSFLLFFFYFYFPASDMVTWRNLSFLWLQRGKRELGFLVRAVFGLWLVFAVLRPVDGLRPLRERARSWGDEVSTGFVSISFKFS